MMQSTESEDQIQPAPIARRLPRVGTIANLIAYMDDPSVPRERKVAVATVFIAGLLFSAVAAVLSVLGSTGKFKK